MPASVYAMNNPAFRGNAALSITGTPASPVWQNVAYSFTPNVNGGSGTKSYTSTGTALPTGLTLSPTTGVISGTPSAIANTSGIAITVTDTSGSATLTFSINVVAQLVISGSPATTGTQGTSYTFTPSSSGGNGTKIFDLFSGTLPAGLSLNPATGAITGTPTIKVTQTGIVIRVTDNSGSVNLASFNLAIASNLSLSGSPGSGTVGVPYTFTPTTSGGTPTYVYANTGAALPSGLTLNTSTGVISGTPTTAATTGSLNMSVTDSLGTVVSLGTFSITVAASGGGGSPSLDFTQASNSQYIGALAA